MRAGKFLFHGGICFAGACIFVQDVAKTQIVTPLFPAVLHDMQMNGANLGQRFLDKKVSTFVCAVSAINIASLAQLLYQILRQGFSGYGNCKVKNRFCRQVENGRAANMLHIHKKFAAKVSDFLTMFRSMCFPIRLVGNKLYGVSFESKHYW